MISELFYEYSSVTELLIPVSLSQIEVSSISDIPLEIISFENGQVVSEELALKVAPGEVDRFKSIISLNWLDENLKMHLLPKIRTNDRIEELDIISIWMTKWSENQQKLEQAIKNKNCELATQILSKDSMAIEIIKSEKFTLDICKYGEIESLSCLIQHYVNLKECEQCFFQAVVDKNIELFDFLIKEKFKPNICYKVLDYNGEIVAKEQIDKIPELAEFGLKVYPSSRQEFEGCIYLIDLTMILGREELLKRFNVERTTYNNN